MNHLKYYFNFHVCLSIRNVTYRNLTECNLIPPAQKIALLQSFLSSTLSSAASPEGLDSARAAGTF